MQISANFVQIIREMNCELWLNKTLWSEIKLNILIRKFKGGLYNDFDKVCRNLHYELTYGKVATSWMFTEHIFISLN